MTLQLRHLLLRLLLLPCLPAAQSLLQTSQPRQAARWPAAAAAAWAPPGSAAHDAATHNGVGTAAARSRDPGIQDEHARACHSNSSPRWVVVQQAQHSHNVQSRRLLYAYRAAGAGATRNKQPCMQVQPKTSKAAQITRSSCSRSHDDPQLVQTPIPSTAGRIINDK